MNKVAIGMDGQINVGVVGMGKMGILHTGILSSLDGVEVKAVADKHDLILSFIRGALPSIKTYKDCKNRKEVTLT